MADFTGLEEQDWIIDQLLTISPRVVETSAPDDVQLERTSDGTIKPYIVVTFQTPFASASGRSIAGGEQAQPHVMPFMVFAFAGDPKTARRLSAKIRVLLVGKRPSETAGDIKVEGGGQYDRADNDSRPSRYGSGSFCKVNVGLGLPE